MSATEAVLAWLDKHPGMYTVNHIAKSVGLPRSSVQKALTKLRNDKKVDRDLGWLGGGYLWYA